VKFKVDENLPTGLVEFLRAAGHDTATAAEEGLGGAVDPRLLAAAVGESRVLLTFDQDFADVRAYPLDRHHGIVVFRLRDQRWRTLEPEVRALLAEIPADALAHALTVVQHGRVRRRTRPAGR
jgi:predicted nuclease of predicted toxin-antitoxin system